MLLRIIIFYSIISFLDAGKFSKYSYDCKSDSTTIQGPPECFYIECGNYKTMQLDESQISILVSRFNDFRRQNKNNLKPYKILNYNKNLAFKAAAGGECDNGYDSSSEPEPPLGSRFNVKNTCGARFGFTTVRSKPSEAEKRYCGTTPEQLNKILTFFLSSNALANNVNKNKDIIELTGFRKLLRPDFQNFGCGMSCSYYPKQDYRRIQLDCIFSTCDANEIGREQGKSRRLWRTVFFGG